MSFFTGRRQTDTEAELPETKSTHIGFDTVLSAQTVLEGTLKSEGNIRLDGTFTGKLDITGNVLVGETALIHADIEARNISIAGKVHGNVIGNKVQLLQTGRIWGDIKANSLTTEEGAFIEGNIAMQNTPIVEQESDVNVKQDGEATAENHEIDEQLEEIIVTKNEIDDDINEES